MNHTMTVAIALFAACKGGDKQRGPASDQAMRSIPGAGSAAPDMWAAAEAAPSVANEEQEKDVKQLSRDRTKTTVSSTPSVTSTSERVCAASLVKKGLPSALPRAFSHAATPTLTASVPSSTTNAPSSMSGS